VCHTTKFFALLDECESRDVMMCDGTELCRQRSSRWEGLLPAAGGICGGSVRQQSANPQVHLVREARASTGGCCESQMGRDRDSCGLTSSRSSSSLCVQVLKLSMAETEESSFFGLFVTEVRPASTSHTLFLYHLPPGTYNCMNIV
jgi:hypothetical protein